MVRNFTRMGRGAFSLLAGLGLPLAAQTLWVPASDPVGIARSGTGVAYGTSLEAASLNPALLVTLRTDGAVFLGAGMEMESSQATLQGNSQVLFSSDRNRFLPSFGAGWKVLPTWDVGLKFDEPFLRHAQMPFEYTGRFQGQSLDLTTRRMEVQASWAASPNWSFGASVGLTRVQYAFGNAVRLQVPVSQPVAPVSPPGGTNPAQGLLETGLAQEGTKNLPSFTLGFRWALNPRWTLAGAWQAPIQGTLPLTAHLNNQNSAVYGLNGFDGAPPVATQAAPQVLNASTLTAGDGAIALPGKATLGIRQRLNQTFTWEADLHYVEGTSLRLPSYPTLTTPSGPVRGSTLTGVLHDGFGLSLMGEMLLTKILTGRIGLSQEAGLREDPSVEPLLGGSKSSTFSAGLGFQVFGGELSLGWMTRISQYRDVKNLDGVWPATGFATNGGSVTRVNGMGHLWSVGFRKAF